jgi:TolA-binding protein
MLPTLRTKTIGLAVGVAVVCVAGAASGDDKAYRAGVGLLGKGLYDLAAAELRTYLKEQPAGAEAANARYSLAVCLVRLNKHAEAAKELDQVMGAKGFEFAPDAMLLRAQCAAAMADEAGASAVLRKLVDEHPTFGQLDRASVMLGESLYKQGKHAEAATVLAGAIEKWPASASAARAGLLAAMAESALGKHEAAAARAAAVRAKGGAGEYAASLALVEAQCRHHLGELAAAMKLYAAAGATGTGVVRTEGLLGLASAARASKDFAAAERALREAWSAELKGELRDRVVLERGKVLLEQGKAEAGMKEFASVEGSKAANLAAEAAYWAGKCETAMGRHAEAAERLGLAAAKFAGSELAADMLFDRAAALSRAGKDAAALEEWGRWRGKFGASPLAAEAMVAEAWCAHRLGKYEQSLDLCVSVAGKKPGAGLAESAGLLVAENEYAAGRMKEALGAYEAFLKGFKESKHAWRASVRRGLCLVKTGSGDEGRAALEAAVAMKVEQDAGVRSAALMAIGELCFAEREWAKGEAWFAMIVKEGGAEEVDAMLRQGICMQRQGWFVEAVPVFERVVKAAPASAAATQAMFEAGQSLIELGKLDEAGVALRQVAAAGNADAAIKAHAERHLATIASKQGKHEEAAKILAKLANAPGGDGGAGLDLASALLAAGKYAEAERALTAMLEANPKGERAGEAAASLVIALNRQGKHEEALKRFEAIGDLTKLGAVERAGVLYERALALRSLEKVVEAAEAYRAVLAEGSTRVEAYAAMDLAQLESKAEKHAAAIELIERGVTAAEKLDAEAAGGIRERGTYLRAATLLKQGKASEAAAALKDFAKVYPKSGSLAAANLLYGEALLATGQAKAASDAFAAAVKADRAGAAKAGSVKAGATLRLGDALAACQEWAASERAYASFLEMEPKSELWFQARFGVAWALENQGKHDAAIGHYREVVEKHKGATAARAQFQIGECLYAQKKYEQASAELLKTDVLFGYPEWSAAAIFEAGRCLAEMGRNEDAMRQFEDVVKRFPGTTWAGMAKERLAPRVTAPVPGRGT